MSRLARPLALILSTALLIAPALGAQHRRGADRASQGAGPHGALRGAMRGAMRDRMRGPGGVTALLDARRELDLTPRQVAQLDSLERAQFGEHQALGARVRPVRDSIAQRARSGDRTPAFRDSLRAQARARMQAYRPMIAEQRARDSSRHAAAERLLTDVQRQTVREIQAERRGYERGRRGPREPSGGRGGMSRRPTVELDPNDR